MKRGIAGNIARAFIDSKLTPLLMVAAVLVGIFGAYLTPREEEPQIVVPLVDVFVPFPGGSAAEVEERITRPLEKIISQIDGVEYVYSMSRPDFAVLTVRFLVGEDMERSLVKLWAEVLKHMDEKPEGAMMPLMKTVSIDDVPVLTLTLWSEHYDHYQLRRVAAELGCEIKKIDNVAECELKGGYKREIRVVLDQSRMQAYMVSPLQIAQQMKIANQQVTSGAFDKLNREYLVKTGEFFESVDDVENMVVGVYNKRPVFLKDVADVIDGPEEVSNYAFFGLGPGVGEHAAEFASVDATQEYPAVTLAIAKRQGSDAMRVAGQVDDKIEALKGTLVPDDIHVTVTRNYGETASEKVSTLLEHLLIAVVAVTLLVGVFLGWRGGLVVFFTVPITFALTLFAYYMLGYTLNRVTLFALIFVVGIVVDDSIIVAENIHRHFTMHRLPPLQSAIAAVSEVGNPTILATFTVIASVLPMAFVSGLMGPYMSPMPIGASIATMFSLLAALVATPWLSYRLLGHQSEEKEYAIEKTTTYRVFKKVLEPFLDNRKKSWMFLGTVTLVLILMIGLFFIRAVKVKILPFDNKSEFQVIIDMPEGTTLEETAAAAKGIAAYLATVPEVEDYQYYAGISAPINFNGLVRHYYLRRGSNVADIQVNLVDKHDRKAQSHDIAKRVRPGVQEIARRYGANAKVVEVPPGPPVLSTLVGEVYGPDYKQQIEFARKVKEIFATTPGVVDVDWMVEDDQEVYQLVVDKEKAALRGVTTEQVAYTLRMALAGGQAGLLHDEHELEPVAINLRLDIKNRSSIDDLSRVYMHSQTGQMVPVSDVVRIEHRIEDKSIYHKNQQRVVYVTGDVAVQAESPIYALLDMNKRVESLETDGGYTVKSHFTRQPFMEEQIGFKWDGEWQITYEVFRDLGVSFAVVLVIIYLLTIGWFQSFKTPLVMMTAIPLSLIGIIPGHLVHHAFFTATSMIGMIALAGIMVRNSVLIIDFIEIRREAGESVKQAVLESAVVRTRPILLTAGTVVIGAVIILFDPIFQGLAISLMWGAVASTMLTLGVVPLIYYMVEYKKDANTGTDAPAGGDTNAGTE